MIRSNSILPLRKSVASIASVRRSGRVARVGASVLITAGSLFVLIGGFVADDPGGPSTSAAFAKATPTPPEPKIIAPLPDEQPVPPEVHIRVHNPIDNFIAARWEAERVHPARFCTSREFARRVYLDIAGVIPTYDQLRTFQKRLHNNRDKLVDQLLGSPLYADHWAAFWGDLLREQTDIRGGAPFAFRDYIRDSLRSNKPLDDWVVELLTAEGEIPDNPAGLFFLRHDQNPDELTITVSQVFLGTELKCAMCHDHKFQPWLQSDFKGMTEYWSGTRARRVREEDVTLPGGRTRTVPIYEVVSRRQNNGTFLTGTPNPDGVGGRQALAQLITDPKNPYFARVAVNRIWARLMGRGLVEPIDSFTPTNKPTHPKLLDWLAIELIKHDYDLKHIIRLICQSRTYGLSSEGGVLPRSKRDLVLFQRAGLRRLSAEQLHDSILQACGLFNAGERRWPRAIDERYPPRGGSFLATFGADDRQTLGPRDEEATIPQALELLNGRFLNEAVKLRSTHPIVRWQHGTDARGREMLDMLYLQTLSREPTGREKRKALDHLKANGWTADAWEDLHWAMINTREFMYIR